MKRSHRRFVALVSLVALAALGACAPTAAPTDAATSATTPPARLELRVAGSQDRLVLDGRVHEVRVVRDPERDGIALSVDLDAGTRQSVAQFTGRHVGEHVEIVVAGRTVAAPVIRDPIDAPALLLTGHDDDDVRRMQRRLAAQ
jgi:preprotein translocase subunit SecD